MKHLYSVVRAGVLVGVLAGPAAAQTKRDVYDISVELDQRANSPTRNTALGRELYELPITWVQHTPVPGVLTALSGQRFRVSELRYNAALHLLEARDSTGRHLWAPQELRAFEFNDGHTGRRFLAQRVRNRHADYDFVELLSAEPGGPLIVAAQHIFLHKDEVRDPVLRTVVTPAVNQLVYDLVWATPNSSYHSLQLKEKIVLRLFGHQAPAIAAYARQQKLSYEDLTDVLNMVNYSTIPLSPSCRPSGAGRARSRAASSWGSGHRRTAGPRR
jgi:hypothetical protein